MGDEQGLQIRDRESFDSVVVCDRSAPDDSRPGVNEVWGTLTIMAVAGPERFGSGRGTPVPTIRSALILLPGVGPVVPKQDKK
jgi:hypothetical protein